MAQNPPLSQRGQILLNLQQQLLTITAANGYSRDVRNVKFTVQTWAQTTETDTPILYIVDEDANYNYHAGKLVEVTWRVALYGVMKNQTPSDMEEFISDIDLCLTKNSGLGFPATATPGNPLGNVVSYTRLHSIVTDNQLFSEIEGSQLFKMTLNLVYTKCYGAR